MQTTIYLEQSAPKCIALSFPCSIKAGCALHLVSADGRRQADYTSPGGGCGMFKPASQHRAPPAQQPRVHDAVKGLT